MRVICNGVPFFEWQPVTRRRGGPFTATRHGSERVGLESVNLPMAIDKDSNGVPEVDVSRRTTKVNLWMIVAVAVFFIITGIIVFNFAR